MNIVYTTAICSFFIYLLAFSPSPALCDDALLKVYGGGFKLQEVDALDIQMESEIVTIQLKKNSYIIDATFEFFNYGKTTTAKVGFSKSGYGYATNFKGVINFIAFETWVNGEKVDVTEVPGEVKINHQTADRKQMNELLKGNRSDWLEYEKKMGWK